MREIPKADAIRTAKNFLKRLIGFNTTTSPDANLAQDTTEATNYLGEFLKHDGAEIHYGVPYEYPQGSGRMHKSMIAVWRPVHPTDKKPIAFSGHIDVVPALDKWGGNDPFQGVETEDAIVGRGALDMKGQIASFVGVMASMHADGKLKAMDRPLMLMLSSCEEVGLQGAKDVCELARKHGLEPDEVIVMEPTDGYIGLGAKGAYQETVGFTNTQPKSDKTWSNYFTISVKAKGGHSSIQGASPADPSVVCAEVLDRVKDLRQRGIPVEICDVSYGTAANVVGGTATITLGYDKKGKAELERYFMHHEKWSNQFLFGMTHIANFLSWKAGEIRGLDLGKVGIEVKDVSPATVHYPVTLSEDGKTSSSAVEQALETVTRIYGLHAEQRKGAKPKNYAIPLLGLTKLSVPIIRGDSGNASIIYDIRYPAEAELGSGGVKAVQDIVQSIHDTAASASVLKAGFTPNNDVKPYEVNPDDPRLASYKDIARKCNFLKYTTEATNVIYGSDGNVISKEFPNALVLTMASGGFSNMPHGEGEHLKSEQIKKNIKLFGAIIEEKTLPAKSHAASVSQGI